MTETGNGSYVTWREFNLKLEPLIADTSEIKSDVKELRVEIAAAEKKRHDREWLGPKGQAVVNKIAVGAVLAALSGGATVIGKFFLG